MAPFSSLIRSADIAPKPGGLEQRLTRVIAAARTRVSWPEKYLAIHAPELVVKLDFQIFDYTVDAAGTLGKHFTD
jgi:hypothetical protein